MASLKFLMRTCLGACLSLLMFTSLCVAADFTGTWRTTYGVMVLEQSGDVVTGDYDYGSGSGTIEGTLEGETLTFTYKDTAGDGEGHFTLSGAGDAFEGEWRADGTTVWDIWNGTRDGVVETGFSGLFDSTYGRLRLVAIDETTVEGLYDYGTGGIINGEIDSDGKLNLTYKDDEASGEGVFELTDDGFVGQWRASGTTAWAAWDGTRVVPEAGKVWLVVLETQWETGLVEEEYSWGEMLGVYFQRMPYVEVRHRRVHDTEDFERHAAELVFLAEPTVLWVSGHGDDEGLVVDDGRIAAEEIIDALLPSPHIYLAHFALCTIMAGSVPGEIKDALPETHDVAISGYEKAVDWGGSAVLELLYLDLLLGHFYTPKQAYDVVMDELNYADKSATPGSPLGAMYFSIAE